MRTIVIVISCILATCALFLAVEVGAATAPAYGPQAELTQLNEAIQKAEDLRGSHLAAAARAEDQGMRWQFMQDQKQEAKRAFERADEHKKEAQLQQQRIDQLKKRRDELLKGSSP
jgi:hypothetical protein